MASETRMSAKHIGASFGRQRSAWRAPRRVDGPQRRSPILRALPKTPAVSGPDTRCCAPIWSKSAASPAAAGRGARCAARSARQILDAAIPVFARTGYHAARVSDIAREAGIAYGLVYHYFRNKEEILETIFEERWTGFVETVEAIAEAPTRTEEKLEAIAALILGAYRVRRDWVKVFVLEIQRSSRFAEPGQLRAVGRFFQAVARILRAGQAAGRAARRPRSRRRGLRLHRRPRDRDHGPRAGRDPRERRGPERLLPQGRAHGGRDLPARHRGARA